jgi:pyruvate/2-oxoglutarate/acetoin dehydrogenase E1 component
MAMQKISYMNAIRDGIAEEMRKNDQIVIFGEGISERGGSYGHTMKLWGEFGEERVIDTPISENGFTALAVGAAAMGMRPIVDILMADILCEVTSPLFHQAAKVAYMSAGQINIPLVFRSQGGGRNGPHHSATLYAVAMHFPGMKVVYPGNTYDAKGMIKTALHTNNPVYFCEDKSVYARREEIPEEEYYVPFEEGAIQKAGKDVTVAVIGGMQYRVKDALAKGLIDADIEIVDPRCLFPLNFDVVKESVKKTGRLVIVEDDFLTCGAGAEIAARIAGDSELYSLLKAPIKRVATLDIPHPYTPVLGAAMAPNEESISEAIKEVCR